MKNRKVEEQGSILKSGSNNNAGPQTRETALPSGAPRSEPPSRRGRRWGVILAGGDGLRLRALTKFICGDERPKQFCPLFEGTSLLEQTLRRSERSIPPEQLMVSLTRHHAKWFSQETAVCPFQRVVQPANKGTAPAILHGLLSVARLDPQAVVAILPCDHHYSDEESFTLAIEGAFHAAAEKTDSVVLLGAKADYPEVEYGWIELGSPLGCEGSQLFGVRAFREKPDIRVARALLEQGSVWNTFVMVGHVQAFLQMVQAALPELLYPLSSARLWAGEETHIEESVYQQIPSVSFSHDVLSVKPGGLAVLVLNDAGWSDLGDPGRVLMALRDSRCEAAWIRRWKMPKTAAAAASGATPAVA
jgi:mannose-1-phosphate guanylyltransferase